MICFLFYFTGTIYFINYTTLVGYETIKALAAENEIDTVYVRFADEDDDRMYDCMKPTHMHTLKKIFQDTTLELLAGGYTIITEKKRIWRMQNHSSKGTSNKVNQ